MSTKQSLVTTTDITEKNSASLDCVKNALLLQKETPRALKIIINCFKKLTSLKTIDTCINPETTASHIEPEKINIARKTIIQKELDTTSSIQMSAESLQEYLRNSYLDKLSTRPSLARVRYTMDQPLAGDGWHNRESDDKTYWRFTGPSNSSSIFLPRVEPTNHTVTLHIFHAITPEHISNLILSYNNFKLPLMCNAGHKLTYLITESAINALPYTKIELTTISSQRPHNDDRMIGIAIQKIEIT